MAGLKITTQLDSHEQLKGFKALLENPFFDALLVALDKEYQQNVAVVLSSDIRTDNLYLREQIIGECRGLQRVRRLLENVIVGLTQETVTEVEKERTSTEVKENENTNSTES